MQGTASYLIFVLLLASATLAAEPPDPRLQKIAEQRQVLLLQQQNAQLLFENAAMKLKALENEEARIKAEKPEPSKK